MSEAKNANFGLPLTPAEELEAVKKQLAEANAKLIAAGLGANADAEPAQNLDSQGFAKEYVKLRIFKGSRKDDLQRVPLGIRGFVVQVERGPEVIIHKVFAEVLEQAIEDVTISGDNELITRPAHRFPYQIIGTATEAEYLAFQASMKAGASAAAVRA
jgi:hypothetical protein